MKALATLIQDKKNYKKKNFYIKLNAHAIEEISNSTLIKTNNIFSSMYDGVRID